MASSFTGSSAFASSCCGAAGVSSTGAAAATSTLTAGAASFTSSGFWASSALAWKKNQNYKNGKIVKTHSTD